ncbi:MAG TPA: GNAT family N-acetyltransferase [Streptosporangiaceae bacterium]
MRYRQATAQDAAAIGALHADSWRRYYRGAYLDSYLDGDVVADRMAEWNDRLSQRRADWYTVVAEVAGAVTGFAHVILDADPTWGAYLDALHVRHDSKRQGVGARLIAETAQWVARCRPCSGLYLWVLEQNSTAQAFYSSQGGSSVERHLAGPFPGGGHAYSFRYAWPDLSGLIGPG